MKIGILVSYTGNFNDVDYYNSQDLGLAKELCNIYDNITIYKPNNKKNKIVVNYNERLKIRYIPLFRIGMNGMINPFYIDEDTNSLIHFSDTQYCVPTIYKWCKKRGIKYIPYIGTIESHSNSNIVRYITDLLFIRNIKVYKECVCCAKTSFVKEKLVSKGINNVIVAPVGLDLTRMNNNSINKHFLKNKHGYDEDDKILLFVGRMEKEKHPVEMINLFIDINKFDDKFKLIMIGTGKLDNDILKLINNNNISKKVSIIKKVLNSNIWEYYGLSDYFINLNENEIFGMAILEAMYYECITIAVNAPGPNYIISDNKYGYIVNNYLEIIDILKEKNGHILDSKRRIINNFSWNATAKIFKSVINN